MCVDGVAVQCGGQGKKDQDTTYFCPRWDNIK
jgi:hypothetical protein